jgi:nitroimidazol reductase NimA-like FMN-containing flavoprotein (pyridoxamine 5'-phosphate oxidase superfamily)
MRRTQYFYAKSITMFGNLENHDIEEVLKEQVVGRIGCHANNITYVVPTSYAYDGTYIYGHTEEGLKIEMMRQNPNICFEVDTMENMANWKSVITWGVFEEVTDSHEREKALKILLDRKFPLISSRTVQLTPNYPFYSGNLNDIKGIVFRIKLNEKTGRYERSDKPIFVR